MHIFFPQSSRKKLTVVVVVVAVVVVVVVVVVMVVVVVVVLVVHSSWEITLQNSCKIVYPRTIDFSGMYVLIPCKKVKNFDYDDNNDDDNNNNNNNNNRMVWTGRFIRDGKREKSFRAEQFEKFA